MTASLEEQVAEALGEPRAGLAAGVVAGGKTAYVSRGEARPGARAVAPDTIFELGSITKVFTGILLASCARDGTVALDRDASVGVVVLSNRARSVDRLGLRLVERLGQ